MAKKRKTYDAAQLKQIHDRLIVHRKNLVEKVKKLAREYGENVPFEPFDDAIAIRDAAQQLSSTCLALKHTNDCVFLAEQTGNQQVLAFHFEDLGLEPS